MAKTHKETLDEVFSQYIRLLYSTTSRTMCRCYTCPKLKSIKRIQNGHFISRTYLATRWDESNCRPQCVGCNMYGGGRTLDFEENLIDEIGEEAVNELKKRRHTIVKLDDAWYEAKILHYKTLVKKMGGWK